MMVFGNRLFFSIWLLLCANVAHAQNASDRLASCLVSSTTGADRVELARWVGIAIVAHPSIRDSIAVPKQVIDQSDIVIAELVTQLLTVRCRDESRDAVDESYSGIEAAFGALGQVAMAELMMDEAVEERIMGFIDYVDDSALSALE